MRRPSRILASSFSALLPALALLLSSCGTNSQAEKASTTRAAVSAWSAGTSYSTGDLVSFGGATYRCVQGHTAQLGWEPTNVPALWTIDSSSGTGATNGTGGATQAAPDQITLDYVTLEVNCNQNPSACCESGATVVPLTQGPDTFSTVEAKQCILAAAGSDTVALQSSHSNLILGDGDDTAMAGPGNHFIWAGYGNDTINAHGGTSLFLAGPGDDVITAANGDNVVVPGPGRDTVALGTGNDTLYIFDLCEVAGGETLDGGTGNDTLVTPVPVSELEQLGVKVTGFEKVTIQQNSCRSECVTKPSCEHGACAEGAHTGLMGCGCDDGWEGAHCNFPDPNWCARHVEVDPSLTGREREIALQTEIARQCTMPDTDDCTRKIAALTNVDFSDAAFSLVGETIEPARYLAVVRDRTKKERASKADSVLAHAICTEGDDDRDLVPNSRDACPNTPPLTPTLTNGCTDTALPTAPPPEQMKKIFAKGGFMIDPHCDGAPLLPENIAGAFYRPSQKEQGSYILSSRVTNQPTGCQVWYFYDIEEYDSNGPVGRFTVAFRENEETTALVGSSMPVPGGHIQFNPLPTDAGSRGRLGSEGGVHGIRFRVRTMNGAGMRSAWSAWKKTTNADCLELGFRCGG